MPNMPHFDADKIFRLFTESEARRVKKLIRDQKEGAVRAMIVAALRRAETVPLSAFVRTKRDRIELRTVPAGTLPTPSAASQAPTGEQREG